MVTDTIEINRQRLDERIGKSIEERQVDATELIADTLESIRSEISVINQMLAMLVAEKE